MRITERIRHSDYLILTALYATLFALAPILSARIVHVGGVKFLAGSVGVMLAYGCGDLINDKYGKSKARETVAVAMFVRFFVYGFILLTTLLPTAFVAENYYNIVVKGSLRLMLATEAAIFFSQWVVDIPVFHWLKGKVKGRFWLRYNISTWISQMISTSVFISLAFIGTGKPVVALILGQFTFKVVGTALLTPVFSGVRRWLS